MAVTDPSTTNPAQFEEDLAAVSAQDHKALQQQQRQAREQQEQEEYARQMAEEENRQRQQSALSNTAQEAGKQLAKKAIRTGLRSLILNPWITIPVGLILVALGLILTWLIAMIVTCNNPESLAGGGWKGRVVYEASRFTANFLGGAILNSWIQNEVCGAFVININTNVAANNTTSENNSMSVDGDSAARAYLAGFGIPVNKPCIDPTRNIADPPGQTCLENILQSTLEEVTRLKTACDLWARVNSRPREITGANIDPEDSYCQVIVTGGTEQGHATSSRCIHGRGFKIDISLRPNINTFIESNYTSIAPRDGDPRWYNNSANATYVRESNHWDISVGCA